MHLDNAALYAKIDVYEEALKDIESMWDQNEWDFDDLRDIARRALKEAADGKKKA